MKLRRSSRSSSPDVWRSGRRSADSLMQRSAGVKHASPRGRPERDRLASRPKNRELATEEDVEALLDELDKRLRAALKDGARIRLV